MSKITITAIILFLVGLGILNGLFAAAVPTTVTADSPITVASDTHKNEFPNQITFSLEANSTAVINKVTLYYKLGKNPVLTYAYPKFDPSPHVKTDYIWNVQKNYIPPGIELHYYWVIEDATGNKLQTEQTSFTVEDTRFKWQQKTSDKINVFWYQGDDRFASSIMGFATKALADVGNRTGVQLTDPVKIYIYANSKDLLGALEPAAQEWTGGRAFTPVSIIVLIAEPNASGLDWASHAVAHELTHVIIHQETDNPYGDIPHWLDEGLAMYSEGPMTSDFQRPLDAAIKGDSLISVKSLGSDFPADPDQARLSYAESYSLVDYIQKKYGPDKMKQLLSIFKEGSTYDDALLGALGVDVDGLETDWRASLGLQPLGDVTPLPQPAATATVAKDNSSAGANQGGSTSSSSNGNQGGGICGGLFQVIGLAGVALVVGLRTVRG